MRTALSILALSLILNFHARGDALDTWTNVTPANWPNTIYSHLIFANGQFVAGLIGEHSSGAQAYPAGAISTSSDGIHWTNGGGGFLKAYPASRMGTEYMWHPFGIR